MQPGGIGPRAVEDALQARRLVGLVDDLVAHGLQFGQPEVAAVFDDELESAAGAQAVDGRGAEHGHRGVADPPAAFAPQFVGDLVGGFPAPPANSSSMTYIEPRLGALAFKSSDWPEMPTVCSTPSAWLGDVFDRGHDVPGASHRGGVGQLHVQEQIALVLLRDKARGHVDEGEVGQQQQAAVDRQGEQAHAQQAADHADIGFRADPEYPVEQPEEPAQEQVHEPGERIAAGAVRLEQQGRQRRAERERVEGREQRGDGDGDGELAEELPGDAADERAGHEHGAEHQGDGDDRAGHFVHGLAGGLARRQPLGQPALDVFHHHDGVVNHDADRQHQAEERQVVEREADAGHDGERAHDGHRHGHQRNQGRPPVLQEHQHHHGHQEGRFAQGLEHLEDGFPDEGRGVVDDR